MTPTLMEYIIAYTPNSIVIGNDTSGVEFARHIQRLERMNDLPLPMVLLPTKRFPGNRIETTHGGIYISVEEGIQLGKFTRLLNRNPTRTILNVAMYSVHDIAPMVSLKHYLNKGCVKDVDNCDRLSDDLFAANREVYFGDDVTFNKHHG